MKLHELQEDEQNKLILAFCYRPRSMADIAVKLDLSIDHTRKEKVPKLVSKKYLQKISTSTGRVLYKLSDDIEL